MKFASAFYETRGDVEPWMTKAADSVTAAADLVESFVRKPRVGCAVSSMWINSPERRGSGSRTTGLVSIPTSGKLRPSACVDHYSHSQFLRLSA
jgi:hypothetical protein